MTTEQFVEISNDHGRRIEKLEKMHAPVYATDDLKKWVREFDPAKLKVIDPEAKEALLQLRIELQSLSSVIKMAQKDFSKFEKRTFKSHIDNVWKVYRRVENRFCFSEKGYPTALMT